MKVKVIQLTVLMLLSLVFFSCNSSSTSEGEWVGYSNNVLKITHPKDWKPVTQDNQVIIYSPQLGEQDDFSDNISIFVNYTASDTVTLEDYTRRHLESIPENFGPNAIESSGDTRVAGYEAKEMYFSFTLPPKENRAPTKIRLWQVWFLKDNKSFLLAFMSEKQDFDALFPTAERIIMSIEPQ